MANYANQKIVYMPEDIKETIYPNKKNNDRFIYVKIELIHKASQLLNGTAFKLYLYFLEWARAESFMFSKQDFINRYGISNLNSATNAVQELKYRGYLKEKENKYYFYPIPHTEV